jgi:Uma2 family endonuclease
MTPKTLMSVEEFMALPGDGMHHELNEGELVVMPPPKRIHSRCQTELARVLANFVTANTLGEVYVEFGYRLNSNTLRAPDVSFVRNARMQPTEGYYAGSPDLAIEVVSPDDSALDLREKVKQYLDAGTQQVWVIYPKVKQVEVHGPGNMVRIFGLDDTLETPDLLPGFQLSVAAILQ